MSYLLLYNRRFSTESAAKMLSILDRKGIPLLLCLTHADKLYANECLRKYGKDCPDDTARRVIERELEVSSHVLYNIIISII